MSISDKNNTTGTTIRRDGTGLFHVYKTLLIQNESERKNTHMADQLPSLYLQIYPPALGLFPVHTDAILFMPVSRFASAMDGYI